METERERERENERMRTTVIKSNNPHLAGGELIATNGEVKE